MEKENSAAGLGVIDLLVALALVALIAGIALPRGYALLKAWRLRAEARMLAQSIDTYATIAKLRDQTLSLAIYPTLYQAHKEALGGELLGTHHFSTGVSAEEASLALYPSGALSPKTITLRSPEDACTVTVALRGRTTIRCQEE
jgi:type II secretory pathway pseudopilin PulG